ncbi:MAG: YdcF family protein [Anaerolineales bacterium]|nr:YdcF family protein [Anaerolineales bacterium]
MRTAARLLVMLIGAGAVVVCGPRLYTALRYAGQMYAAADVPAAPVALVFGAGLNRNGSATPILYDRVATAADLYHAGRVGKLLLSGATTWAGYNEPLAMSAVARELGVPDDALVLDSAGERTYDSCYRAQAVYGVTDAILVTQAFHLPRALFLCEALGIQASGVAADRRVYREQSVRFWSVRELFATLAAAWDVVVARPVPTLS